MNKTPPGVSLIAVFFALAACILVGVGAALLCPGTGLEGIWRLYPARRALLMPHRVWLGPGFLALAVIMVSASIGCFLRRYWGWQLAVAIFSVNAVGDAIQLAMGHFLEGGIGLAVAGVILFYLFRPDTRKAFR